MSDRYRSRSSRRRATDDNFISTSAYDRVVQILYQQLPKNVKDFLVGHMVYVLMVKDLNVTGIYATGTVDSAIRYCGIFYTTVPADLELRFSLLYEEEKKIRQNMAKNYSSALERLSEKALHGPSVISTVVPTLREIQSLRELKEKLVVAQSKMARRVSILAKEMADTADNLEIVTLALRQFSNIEIN